MKKKMNFRKKMIAGMLCMALGSSMALGNAEFCDAKMQDRLAFTEETVAYEDTTEETTDTAEEATTETTDGTEINEEPVLNSTYFAYGEGCIFVTVNKDSNDTEETSEETTELDNVDNLEELEETETPEETPEAQSVTEETDYAANMVNTGITSGKALIDACLTEEEKQTVIGGANQELRVTFHNAQEDELKKNEVSELGDALNEYQESMDGFCFSNYVQITFEKRNLETGKWETMKELLQPVSVELDILSEVRVSGYEYYLIKLGENGSELLEDDDQYMETITCEVDGSYTFGLCYVDKEEEETVETTPIPTEPQGFWNRLVSDDLCLWHWFTCAILVIGLTWIAAINRVKIRRIFLIVMSVICIAMAILGHCSWDIPVTISAIVLMILLHVARVFYDKNR